MNSARYLAPDHALPQRDRLLEEHTVSRRLIAALRVEEKVHDLERIRIKYRFGESLRALYRGRDTKSGMPTWISMRALSPGRAEHEFERARERALSQPGLEPWRVDRELHAVYWRFPNDRRISNLAKLRIEAPIFSEHGISVTSFELAAYAPEKCATARCFGSDGRVIGYAKVYATREAERVAREAASLRDQLDARLLSNAQLSLPRMLGAHADTNMHLIEPIEGRLLKDLKPGEARHSLMRLGSALAELHELHPPVGARPFKRLAPQALQSAARQIGSVRPDLAGLAEQISGRLIESIDSTASSVCLHGDLHPKNAIVKDKTVALIDLDQSAIGDPAIDLGSLIAAVHCARIVDWPFPVDINGAHEMLVGYARHRRLPSRERLRWHTVAALFAERCLRAVNRLRPHSLANLEQLLTACDRGLGDTSLDV